MSRFIYVFGLSFCLLSAVGSEPIAQDVRAALRSLAPAEIEQVANGDLDGDGHQDVAYLVKWSDPSRLVIGLLRRRPDGALANWVQTKPFDMSQRDPVLEIRGKSLYVSQLLNGLSWSHSITDQYAFRKGRLVCIGTEDSMRYPAYDFEPGPHKESITSANFLTCRKVEITIENSKRREVASPVEDCRLQTLEENYSY